MKNSTIIILIIALAILGLGVAYFAEVPQVETSIVGCYVARLGQDVYSLDISSQNVEDINGTLVFDNFQKDSSSGSFEGTYEKGVLLGDYSFRSEGTDSVMQVIFKRMGDNFVRGHGPLNETGDRFVDPTNITFDGPEFVATEEVCVTSLLTI